MNFYLPIHSTLKFVSKKHPSIEHRYDVWHVSKGMGTESLFKSIYITAGVKKKLVKLGNYILGL